MCRFADVPICRCAYSIKEIYKLKIVLAHWHIGILAYWHIGTLLKRHIGTLKKRPLGVAENPFPELPFFTK